MEKLLLHIYKKVIAKDCAILIGCNKEGLLSPLALTQSADELKAQGENGGDVILGAMPGLIPRAVNIGAGGRWVKYIAVEPLEGPAGLKQTVINPYSGMDFTRAVITRRL